MLPGFSFNPVWGCSRISVGPRGACEHCYAESFARRVGMPELWQGEFRTFGEKYWRAPLDWNRKAEQEGARRRVFCASMADVFDNRWPAGIRERLWDLIEETPHLDWLLLTKRIGNAKWLLPERWAPTTPANVWLGATVATQEEAERDIPKLLAVPARTRFLSCEPLLGPITLERPGPWSTWLEPCGYYCDHDEHGGGHRPGRSLIDWVICGGESGHQARPMHPDWARSLRDQCVRSRVPFLFKQWGEFAPVEMVPGIPGRLSAVAHNGEVLHGGLDLIKKADRAEIVRRVGKKAAGRILDGRTWDQFPDDQPW